MFGTDSSGIYYWNVDFEYDSENTSISLSSWLLLRSFHIPKIVLIQAVIGFRATQGLSNMWYAGILVPFAINDFDIYSLFLYIYSKEAEITKKDKDLEQLKTKLGS